MWYEHIKGWLVEERKEEAATVKTAAAEGATVVIRGTVGEETELIREKTSEGMTNW